MTEDRTVAEALRGIEDDGRTLDPARVISAAKRRRGRRVAVSAVACAAGSALALSGFLAAAGTGGSGEVPVAGGEDPPGTVVTPQPGPTASPTEKPWPRWTPGGPIGAKPIGTIPAAGRVAIATKYWFETKGTKWCITQWDPHVRATSQPHGCRATIGNKNLGDGRDLGTQGSVDAAGRRVLSSVFRGEARRIIYAYGPKYYEAKVYRLAAVPGWLMATASFEPPAGSDRRDGGFGIPEAVFAYDAAGKLIGQVPSARDGGPTTHPLAQR